MYFFFLKQKVPLLKESHQSKITMINDNSVVPRDAAPRSLWPDTVQEHTKKASPRWFIPTLILGMILTIGLVLGLRHNSGVSRNSNDNPELDELFGSCSVEDVLFQCSADITGLDPTIPACIADCYNDYRENWVLTVDPNFEHDISVCAPANKALMVVACYAQNHNILTETELKTIYGLANFYFSLKGESWLRRESWLSENPVEEWLGVEVNNDGEVVSIKLPNNLVGGALLPFPALDSLKRIDLSQNYICGSLPEDLGNLEVLQLENNKFTGTIPVGWTKSTDLRILRLGSNYLNGNVPSEVGEMEQLEELSISTNDLVSTIPSEIGACASLQVLDMSYNRFKGTIPREVGKLKLLEYLDLSSNSFDEGVLPAELFELASLESLYLSACKLTGTVPTAIGHVHNLTYLELSSNKLYGALPSEIGLLWSMTHLNFGFNGLNGTIPSELGKLTAVEQIDLSSNEFTGILPTEMGLLLKLETFLFSGNHLNRPIPDEICSLWERGDLKTTSCRSNIFEGPTCPYPECCRNCIQD